MIENILNDILDINQDINNQYRNSKAPKIIRNITTKKARNKLKKMINESLLNDHYIRYDILKEYLELLYTQFPPNGTYQHIASVHKSIYNDIYIIGSTVSYDIPSQRNKISIICDLSCIDNEIKISYDIRFNNNPNMKFSDSLTELKKEKIQKTYSEYSKEYLALMAKNTLIDSLNNDIKKFLLDRVNQSEQIEDIIGDMKA